MKDNRAPVAVDILYSLEWYLIAFSVCVPFIYSLGDDPLSLCMRLLPSALLFIVSALVTRLVKHPALRIALPFAAAAANVFFGRNMLECILIALLGIFSIICGFVIHFTLRRGSSRYNSMLLIIPPLIVMALILTKFEMHSAATCVNFIMAVFLPIYVAVWYLNKLVYSVSIFTERGGQPISRIKKRMYGVICASALIVLFITLLVPQSNGVSFLAAITETAVAGVFAVLIAVLEKLPFRVSDSDEFTEELSGSFQPPISLDDSVWDIYLLYTLAALILIILIISAIVMLVRLIRYLVEGFMKHDISPGKVEHADGDIVEKIERPAADDSRSRLGKTNAGKIRRIYKKKVSSVLTDSRGRLSSLTPNEISALCRRKGVDITELTKLYKKARYTNCCTEDDVKAAKRL